MWMSINKSNILVVSNENKMFYCEDPCEEEEKQQNEP